MPPLEPEVTRALALRAIDGALLRLKWLAAATRFEIAMRRHDRALKYAYKYGYNPAQPRVPAGDPAGGQWTSDGSTGRVRLAGKIPTGDSPEIPKEKPNKSWERTSVLKQVARECAEFGLTVAAYAELYVWLVAYTAQIKSYTDPPKSLEELQKGVSTPEPGYDIHHIVEQTQAERDGFPRDVIDGPDNRVLIPRLKHQEINGWYQTPNADYDWETPRDYLSGRSWAVRRSVGLTAMRIFGVLKP